MTWYAFKGKNSGKAIDLAGAQEKIATTWGFHGYGSEAQAEAKPNSVNVVTGGEADLLISDYKAAVAEKAQPGGKNASNPVAAAAAGDAAAAKDAAHTIASDTGINAVGDFFNTLGQKNLWIRVAKVAVGAVLLIVGAAKLTGIDKQVGAVGKVVAKAPLL